MIIFLNGGSSVGKSSLVREIMSQSAQPFCYFSVDYLVNEWIDEKFVSLSSKNPSPEQKEWFYHVEKNDKDGQPIVIIADGFRAKKLHYDIIKSWAFLAQQGHCLIIDEVIWEKEIFDFYLAELANINPIYLIKVTCDLAVAITREQKRSDRFLGLARGLYQVDKNITFYDLVIDSSVNSPSENAQIIWQFIQKNPAPSAFNKNKITSKI